MLLNSIFNISAGCVDVTAAATLLKMNYRTVKKLKPIYDFISKKCLILQIFYFLSTSCYSLWNIATLATNGLAIECSSSKLVFWKRSNNTKIYQ